VTNPRQTHYGSGQTRGVSRREFLVAAGAAGLGLGLGARLPRARAGGGPTTGPGRPPNFLVILCDDLHYSDVGCFGSTEVPTPNINALAAGGMKLTSFYVSPICSPTRASFMTGCYPIRVGIPGNIYGDGDGLAEGELTIAAMLKAQGYATACVGKWMLGGGKFLPTRRGFDHFCGLKDNNRVGNGLYVDDKQEGTVAQQDMTDRWTERAVAWIREHKDEPFFLYLSHTAPHYPQVPHPRFAGKSQAGNYGDEIVGIDWSTGEVMKALRELGIERDTLVVFTSDNGRTPQLTGEKGAPRKPKAHGPLRGQKGDTFEGGVRVPCIARWPGAVPAGKSSGEITSIMDLMPTFAVLSGATIPKQRITDGFDLGPILRGEAGAASPYKQYCYYLGRELQAVRAGKWKYHTPHRGIKEGGLFDLETDLGEAHDVQKDRPEVVERMQPLLATARAELGDGDRVGSKVRAHQAEAKP
jgi:arylsulfatase